MSFFALTALINAITSSILGLFIYLKDRKQIVNKIFALFCISVAVWSYAYYFWQTATSEGNALFWSRALMFGAIFIPFFYFHFILAFLEKIKEKKVFLIFSYFVLAVFLIFSFTPLFIKGVSPKLFFNFWPEPGPAYHPFLLIWLGYVGYCTFLLFSNYKRSFGIKKAQIKFILLGITIGFIGGSTNYLLWYDIPIPPVGNILVVAYVIFTALAIAKYHLMNIKVLLAEFLVGIVGLVLFIDLFISRTSPIFLLKIVVFNIFCFLGYLLIKSVLDEVKRREEREKVTKELEKASQQLQKLDKAKSEFISIASHQLRTPLTAIKGYISMMIENTYGRPPKRMKKPLQNIYTSNERLIKLINDLLSVSRIESGKMEMKWEEVDVKKLIDSIILELKHEAVAKKNNLIFEKPKDALPKIKADEEKLRQVIMNVIDNAIRYTNQGGIVIQAKIQANRCKIQIKDTGEGMNKDELDKLFESFRRGGAGTKNWTEGAGLGLHVAKKFIGLHNGKIWAESKGRGKGSTFNIELPLNHAKN